jgi:hypothetical protein
MIPTEFLSSALKEAQHSSQPMPPACHPGSHKTPNVANTIELSKSGMIVKIDILAVRLALFMSADIL